MMTIALAVPLMALLAQAALPETGLYRVGAGDVLEVTVRGRDDLSRTPTVQTSGSVWLPVAGELTVAGLTPPEIEGALVRILVGKSLEADVQVRVKEYQNQFVWVGGEVNRPGRKPLRGGTRLLDALVEAGGFSVRASGEVVVSRLEGTFPNGTSTLRADFDPTGAPGPGEQAALATVLRNGDTVTAPQQSYVTVEGEVVRPGRYAIGGETTLSGLVSTAGGVTRSGRSRVSVRRIDPETGAPRMLEVDLKAVQEGKQPDLRLLPNDAVSVKPRRVL